MRRIATTLFLCFLLGITRSSAQDHTMHVVFKSGAVKALPVGQIASISFKQDTPPSFDGLTGRWMLIAMPNGAANESGIHTAKADTIRFTAAVSEDGNSLICHADTLYARSGNVYPANWSVVVEENKEKATRRLGWVISAQEPVSSKEFLEPREKYLENGMFYWGPGSDDNDHRYIYLLSENISTQKLEGMTLWSDWESVGEDNSYTFAQNQEVYGVVSATIPFASAIGYFDIWASPRFIRITTK